MIAEIKLDCGCVVQCDENMKTETIATCPKHELHPAVTLGQWIVAVDSHLWPILEARRIVRQLMSNAH